MIVMYDFFGTDVAAAIPQEPREFIGPPIFVGDMWAFPVAYCEASCRSQELYPLVTVEEVKAEQPRHLDAELLFKECQQTEKSVALREEALRLYLEALPHFRAHPWSVEVHDTLQDFNKAVSSFGPVRAGRAR